ncbi:hypothetical protein FSP39_003427 [Pinctada imbricata]|uniref:3'-5' exonuclease n=1 Tax=Pinctada imbricata TaxID=66713 RepID=A0AA88XEH0_PINIB|nr:hypothetical protein FSP39_003427 [Pinctada imbricata]
MSCKKRSLPAWMSLSNGNKRESDQQQGGDGDTDSVKQKRKIKEAKLMKASMDFDKVLQDSLQELKFQGNIVYSSYKSDCRGLCEDIELSLCDVEGAFIGFDMEWPVTYEVGNESKTAVIQICMGPASVYVFHLSAMGCFPKALQCLIQNEKILKVGVGIESDLWKLDRDFDAPMLSTIKNSMVDLSKFANQKLKTTETWSLEGLVRHLFHKRLSKDPSVRKGDWSRYPLTEEQKSYAASDAYASCLVYEKLRDKEKPA